MKILVIGSDKVYAIENFYVKHLREWEKDIYHFPAQSIFYDYYNAGIGQKLLFKLGLSSIHKHINALLMEKIGELQPDIVWVFKGMEIFPETLEKIKERKIKLVNYNPDNPFVFSGKGSGNRNVTESIGLFDLHLTYNLEIRQQLEDKYSVPVAYLPFGFEVEDELYNSCTVQQEVLKVCFVGNPDEGRARFIHQMANAGVHFDIYGNDWNRFINHDHVTLHQPVYKDEFWRTLYRYRVQLNLMRQHNMDSHNMRTFEVPGIGGIMLAPATREHLQFFEDNIEAAFFGNLAEAVEKTFYLLNLPAEEAGKIRNQARVRSIASGYNYRERARSVFNILKDLLSE